MQYMRDIHPKLINPSPVLMGTVDMALTAFYGRQNQSGILRHESSKTKTRPVCSASSKIYIHDLKKL